MRSALALALALGCSSSKSSDESPAPSARSEPTPKAADDAGPVLVTPDDGGAAATGPRITLSVLGRYRDPSFGAVDLPAVSADGKKVAFARELADGGRGNPNLDLVIRDAATDKNLEVIEVLPVEPRWKPAHESSVRERIAAANRRLSSGTWKPMEHPSYDTAAVDGDNVTLVIGSLTVRGRGDRLEIARGATVVARRQLRGWLGPGDQGCRVAPRLRAAHAGSGLVLVEIGFEGDDGCWREPQRRVIRL